MPIDAYTDLHAVSGGFAEPVAESQITFRLVLEAMAHPGRIVELPYQPADENNRQLGKAATAVGLTLLDLETPIWLQPELSAAAPFLRFHCGSSIVTNPGECRFAFARAEADIPTLESFDLGSEEYPDRSTTLVLEVAELGRGHAFMLRGPGIRERTRLEANRIPPRLWDERRALAPLFPRGVDLLLTCGRRLAAIPRTTLVEN
jgi:alpha-D-ribose 1-methylphosphonate 5-triphosphate synthase subunit PhnH